jgi:DNA polymerase III epsilon subunit-like protein
VQREVRELIDGHVIAGHSLENDFRVLGFFPPRHMRRDTAHDVPRLTSLAGRPRKLRHITWEFLGLTIQDSDAGHDPLEDARAALLLYKRFQTAFEAAAERHEAEARVKAEVAERRRQEAGESAKVKAA